MTNSPLIGEQDSRSTSNDRPIQIWYLFGRLDVGGAERTLIDLANNLDRELFDVTIWTIGLPGELAKDIEPHVSLKPLGARNKVDIRAPIAFAHALRRESPDILQSFLFFDNTLSRIASLASPSTTLITGIRAVPTNPSAIRELTNRLLVERSDYIISNSEAGAQFAITNRGANPEKVAVIYNGRDLDAYGLATAPPSLRKELGISSKGPVVGSVGRLHEQKGHSDLLNAWPSVLEEVPNAQLLIVGDGPERSRLLNQSHTLNIHDSVHFPGMRDDIPEILDLLDIFVFPSYYEGLPGALIEAMAAGLPIVTTPVDGCSELVTDNVTGLYTPVGNTTSLSRNILKLLRDPDLAQSLGAEAAQVAQRDFSLETMVSQFETLYTGLQ